MRSKLRGFFNSHLLHSSAVKDDVDILISSLLILLVFLVPLFPANHLFGYEKIKIIFFLSMVTLSGLVWFVGSVIKPEKYKTTWTAINKTAFTFISVLVVTSFLGINFTSSLFGNDPYFQGVISYLYLYLLYLMVKTVPVRLKVWVWIFVASSVIVSIWAIRDFILLHYLQVILPTFSGRVVASFGQPNLYSGFVLLCLPFSLFLLGRLKGWGKFGLFGLIVIQLIGIGVSFSRASIFLVVPIFVIWAIRNFHDRVIKIVFGVFGVLGGVAVAVSIYFSSGLIYSEVISPLENRWMGQNSPEKRYYIWYVIFDSVKERPLQGFGLENLVWVFGKSYNPNSMLPPFYHSVKDLTVDRSHNYTLDLLVFSGVLGLLSWLGLLGVMFKRDKSKLLAVWLLVYVLWIQFQIQGIVHLMLFWMVVGLIDKGESLDLA